MVPSPRARRLLPPSLLALVLAIGTVAGAVGRDAVTPTVDIPAGVAATVPAPTGAVLAEDSRDVPADREPVTAVVPPVAPAVLVGAPDQRPRPKLPAARPAVEVKGARVSTSTSSGTYRGRNHVWMPAIGIDRSVSGYACSNQSYPGNRVYRWGCAGANNVYLFGHAHSVFKPLHDAYVRGTLKKGQELFYADSGGTVHRYTVAWWKVTTPTKGTWAYASQSSPSLTLQTCLGKQSQYRLIVRLTRAD
jgi:hypothetical protein